MPLLCFEQKTGWCHRNDNKESVLHIFCLDLELDDSTAFLQQAINTEGLILPILQAGHFGSLNHFEYTNQEQTQNNRLKGQRGWRPWDFHWSSVVLSYISCHRLQKEDTADTFALTPMMTLLWSVVKQAGEQGFRGVFLRRGFRAQSAL